jgi:outer membrane biosynthesis protein TonB
MTIKNTITKKALSFLAFCLLGGLSVCAQTPLEKMNEIKMSADYIWDEFTHPDPDSASVGAMKRLVLYMDSPQNREITIEDIKPNVKFIKMKRSVLTRVFAYIKKEEANAIIKKIAEEKPAQNQGEDVSKAEEPVNENMMADNKRKEEKAERKEKREERKEKKKKDKQDKADTKSKEKKSEKQAGDVTSGKSSEISKTDPAIDSPVAEQQAFSGMTPVVQKIQELGEFYAVHDYLSKSKEDGTIQSFGALKDAPDLNDCQLAIFNKQSTKLVGVLSTTPNGETRRNLTTGEIDSLGNYADGQYIAIWFK